MISHIPEMKKARELRLSGRSLSEISKEMGIPRSTLSRWLKDIALTKDQMNELQNRINPKISRGRMNASIARRAVRMFNERKVFEDAEKEFKIHSVEPFFIAGLSLYWAHGAKKGSSFQFTSSDKYMIVVIKKWMENYLNIDESLVKQVVYGDSIRIYVSRIDVLRRVVAWQKLLIKYYANISSV